MKRATLLSEALVLATILLFSLSKANAQNEGPNGHYYKVVLEPNLHWETARLKAAESTFNGLHGHLATITSYDEDKFIESLRTRAGSNSVLWVGGHRPLDNATTAGSDGWFWVNGEGRIPTENDSALYSNWLESEPNSGSDAERFLAVGRDNQFGWSSESVEGKIEGYVIEYPGAGRDTAVSVTTVDPFAIENLADPATFEFRRRGNLSFDLPVFYSISGTAVNGVDYDEISRSIVIPAGESSVRLNIIPRGDDSLEAMETIGIRVEPSPILTPEAAYSIDPGLREAGAVIYEQDAPGSAVLRLAVPRDSTVYPEGEAVVLLAAVSSPTPVERVDFWARTGDPFVGVSNKIGSAVAINRTNELAFYRFAWTNPIPGEYFMTALATNGNTRLGSGSTPVRVIVQGPAEPPVVRIRSVPLDATADVLANSESASGYFEVSRTGSMVGNLQVHYSVSGSATAGADYETLQNYVVIGAGRASARILVAAIDDDIPEPQESVTLSLIAPTNAPRTYVLDPTNRQATVWIIDNDPTPVPVIVSVEATRPETVEPRLGISDPAELIAPGEFTFRRTGRTNDPLSVYYALGGTATVGLDYHGVSNRIDFPAGKSEVTAIVLPFGDNLVEGDETVVVELAFPPTEPGVPNFIPYFINSDENRAVVTIHDRTPQPTNIVVSVEATRPETSEPGIASASDPALIIPGEFTFRRKGNTNSSLNVVYVLGGTATAGLDYNGLSNRIEFPAGKSEVKANVVPFMDNLVEGDETVVVELTQPPIDSAIGSYTIDPEGRRAVVTIDDSTPQPPTNIIVSVEATRPETSEPTDASLTERPLPGEFTFRRRGSTNSSLNVFYVLGGTATAGVDYNGLSNRIEFPAGKSEVKANVFPFADNLVEGDETVVVELIHPLTDSNIGIYTIDPEGRRAVVTIHDGTPQPPTNIVVSVEATRPETSEPGILSGDGGGDGGVLTLPGEFTFRRTGSTDRGLNVYYAVGGTATAGLDYNGLSNRIEFPAGKSEVKAFVTALADHLVEGDETVVVELIVPRLEPVLFPGYSIDPDKRRAVVTIHDRTGTNIPIVTVEATRPDTWEPGRNDIETVPGVFTIRRRGPTNTTLAVHFVLDGSAKLGADYTTDTNVIEFAPGQSEATRLVRPLADELVEGDETVVMRLLDRPVTYVVSNEGARATVTIHDRSETNIPPKVVIVRPADGATFIQGESVPVVVEAGDRDGIAKLELLVDGAVVASVEGPRLETQLRDLALGGHLLLGRAMDNSNLVSTSAPVRILIRHRDAVCFVKRNLPETYAPGVTLTVELRATPPEGTHAYAVEDEPPAGWQVGEISHNGVFDPVNRKVKFGPYTDSENRLLTYRVTPPASASGRYTFAGSSSVNGALYPICGDETLEPMQQYHPADVNENFTIVLSEVTAYAAAWKSGDTWPVPPNPIPLNYVTRAAMIWRRGEHYVFDPSQGPAPACWVPSGGSAGGMLSAMAAATAERLIPEFQPGINAQVQVIANPPSTAASYAIEEKPPRGWTVANISHDGVFDADTGVIRWGVFFDATPRTLSYTVTPPAGVGCLGDFNGEFSHDGSLLAIVSASVVVEAPTPIQITGVAAGLDSVALDITGPVGQTAVIESSSDFVNWTEVQSIFIPDGEVGFKTEPTASGALFYRLRVR